MRIYLLTILFTLSLFSFSQKEFNNSPKDFGFSCFSIKSKGDTINFIVSDTSFDIKKPVFIFVQGSQPYALFWKEEATNHTWQNTFPFDEYKQHLKDYYFVIISRSGIPIFTSVADSNYYYVDPITKKIPEKYHRNNNLNYRVKETNAVINYIAKQRWADKSKIILAGHSEGTKVVAKVSAVNKNITNVIFLNGNPYSRFDQGIREIERSVLLGKKTSEEGNKEIDELNNQITYWYQHPNDTLKGTINEPYKEITSFYEPIIPYLLKIKTPLFIAYGTKDIVSENCNLLPFEFARVGKTNLTLKSYLDCDHIFKRKIYDKEGKIIKQEDMFDTVASDFFDWLQSH